jgi:hypothetical protein
VFALAIEPPAQVSERYQKCASRRNLIGSQALRAVESVGNLSIGVSTACRQRIDMATPPTCRIAGVSWLSTLWPNSAARMHIMMLPTWRTGCVSRISYASKLGALHFAQHNTVECMRGCYNQVESGVFAADVAR